MTHIPLFIGALVSVCDNGTSGRAIVGSILKMSEEQQSPNIPIWIKVMFEPYGWFMDGESNQRVITRTFYLRPDFNEDDPLVYENHYNFVNYDDEDGQQVINEFASVVIDSGWYGFQNRTTITHSRPVPNPINPFMDFEIRVSPFVTQFLLNHQLPLSLGEQIQLQIKHASECFSDSKWTHLELLTLDTEIEFTGVTFTVESGSGNKLKEYEVGLVAVKILTPLEEPVEMVLSVKGMVESFKDQVTVSIVGDHLLVSPSKPEGITEALSELKYAGYQFKCIPLGTSWNFIINRIMFEDANGTHYGLDLELPDQIQIVGKHFNYMKLITLHNDNFKIMES